MIRNLSEYFKPEQRYYLQNISYNRLDKFTEAERYALNCTDNIQADVNDPVVMFDLSVSFGSVLDFD